MTNYLEVKNLSKSKGIYYGADRAKWLRQDNHHQTHPEYAQAQRRRNQNHGAG